VVLLSVRFVSVLTLCPSQGQCVCVKVWWVHEISVQSSSDEIAPFFPNVHKTCSCFSSSISMMVCLFTHILTFLYVFRDFLGLRWYLEHSWLSSLQILSVLLSWPGHLYLAVKRDCWREDIAVLPVPVPWAVGT
jgi:hypothetical protein